MSGFSQARCVGLEYLLPFQIEGPADPAISGSIEQLKQRLAQLRDTIDGLRVRS